MARISFLSLFALASVGFAAANSAQEPLQGSSVSSQWSWHDCGKISEPSNENLPYSRHTHTLGIPTDPVRIKSIEISPDPPTPGANLTVKVVGQANEIIEVGLEHEISILCMILTVCIRMEHMQMLS